MTENTIPNPPRALRILTLLAALGAGLGAAVCLYIALAATDQVLWGSAGFLVIMLVAALFGVLAGLGKFRAGFGMAAFATASTVMGGAIFAWRDLASNVGRDPAIGPKLMPWLGFESICALTILIAGGAVVLSRDTRSWGKITKSLAYLFPAAVLLAAGYALRGKIPTEDGGRAIALGVLLAGGALIGVLVSIGGHHLIRAFEITTENPNTSRS